MTYAPCIKKKPDAHVVDVSKVKTILPKPVTVGEAARARNALCFDIKLLDNVLQRQIYCHHFTVFQKLVRFDDILL